MTSIRRGAIVVLACLLCASAGARSARAQTAADTAGLARAMASVIADSLVAKVSDLVVWRSFDNAFDARVADELRSFPSVGRPAANPRHAIHVGVRSVEFEGDTARVLLETSQHYADRGPGMTGYISRDNYVFGRTGGGWQYRYVRNVTVADFGEVRGR